MKKILFCLVAAVLIFSLLTGCQCSHVWTDATCRNPKTCSSCGVTEGDVLAHSWQEANCTAAKICSACGVTEGTALGHSWQEATCTTVKTCSLCAATEGTVLEHSWQEATCTAAKTCTACALVEGEPLSHDYQLSNGAMQCTGCGIVDTAVPIKPPLAFPSDNLTPEQKLAFIDLEGQNNLRNNSRFLYHEGMYYGQYWDQNGQSVFVRADLATGDVLLLDYGWAKNIYISGDNIYYENIQPDTQDHGIYRINMKDGVYVSKEKIVDSYGSMQLKGDYIYYSDFSDQYVMVPGDQPQPGLFRCDLNGENAVKILDKPVQEFYVFDTGILYQDTQDGRSIHSCYLDGSGDQKLNSQNSTSAIFDGEYIYYLSDYDERDRFNTYFTCWKMRADGSENAQVSMQKIHHAFLVYEDTIYFCGAKDESRLYRMDLDGSKVLALTEDKNVYYVQILNGEIKYTKYNGEYIQGNYICSLEGENLRELIPYTKQ